MKPWGVLGIIMMLVGCGNSEPEGAENVAPVPGVAAKPAIPKFGETPAERGAREAIERKADLGTYWVKAESATEHSTPNGPVVNRVYYGQKFTIYEKRGEWFRTVEDGSVPRWTRASALTDKTPPAKPAYVGPSEYQDDRIAPDAIPSPGEYGLTRADVDTLRKGAKLVLQSRPDCSRIEVGDKSVKKPNTYYVTCRIGGSVQNVFFTRAEADAARLN